VKIDPGTHKGMYSILTLKLCVIISYPTPDNSDNSGGGSNNNNNDDDAADEFSDEEDW
jgi:hypothetical protein